MNNVHDEVINYFKISISILVLTAIQKKLQFALYLGTNVPSNRGQ